MQPQTSPAWNSERATKSRDQTTGIPTKKRAFFRHRHRVLRALRSDDHTTTSTVHPTSASAAAHRRTSYAAAAPAARRNPTYRIPRHPRPPAGSPPARPPSETLLPPQRLLTTRTPISAGIISGRFVRVCGQIGVRHIASTVGINNRPARRKRIRRRTRRRRNNQPVGLVFANETIARPGLQIHDARDGRFRDHHVVQRLIRRHQWPSRAPAKHAASCAA